MDEAVRATITNIRFYLFHRETAHNFHLCITFLIKSF